jgi:prolyl oligopeptidase
MTVNSIFAGFIFLFFMASIASAQSIKYPVTKKIEHVDEYHGMKVSDPYRWLEDDMSEETAQWVKAQNEVTFAHLEQIPYRKQIFKDLEAAYNYPKYSAPRKKGEYYYFYKNNGLQNHSVLYRQKDMNAEPEVVIDPNTLSADGTVGMGAFVYSKDGNYAAYTLSKGGSDWQEITIMDLRTLKNLPEKLEWVKVSGISWKGDGFYYSRYPAPEGSALAAKNENHQVYFHKIGTPQSADRLVYSNPGFPQRFNTVSTTDDEKFALLYVSDRGSGKDGHALYILDEKDKLIPIKEEITNFNYGVADNFGDVLLIQTNEDAPNGKVVTYDTKTKKWGSFLDEKPEPLRGVSTGGRKVFVTYFKDVASKVYVYSESGKMEKEVALPGLGSAGGFDGEKTDASLFYTYTSFNYPPTIFSYDVNSGKSTVFRKPEVKFDPEAFEVKQIFFKSKDGTQVPMFMTYSKNTTFSENTPVLLYGYGGFNISLSPSFSPTMIPLLEQGFVFVQVNLRGGGEYGQEWHEQGMKLKKQNVFDDFIAAAEYLIANKMTSPGKLAIRGGSNGGTLVGAVMNQRPELFKVALPAVGVMDMLRFQKFTIGWNWIADYGSSDNADEFKVLYAYSPLHNIRKGVNYPATLVTTADHDDRVVPAHSFKYAAALQEIGAGSSKNPLLIRIDTNSGHGSSNTTKALELTADTYAFLCYHLGVTWK